MQHLSYIFLTAFLLFNTQAVLSSEEKSTAEHQQALNLTIYNGGRALVRDLREFTLSKPTSSIAFMDVAQNIMPQTVAIKGLDVLEQNYDFDLLSPQSLINKNIGKTVRLARRSSETGETLEWAQGTILSTNGGIILRMQDGSLESLSQNKNYHMVFDQVPDNLRATPTLSLTLQQPDSGRKQVEMTYLTGGLSWQSDYVLQLEKDEKSARLDSWITLNNQSGIGYTKASLQLLAGDVNLVREQPIAMRMEDSMAVRSAPRKSVSQQALHGYHLYTVPHKTTINNNQSKQVKLFAANNISISKRLQDRAYVNMRGIETQKSKPDQHLLFTNKKPYLGLPIPKGTLRVYAKDAQGNNQFIGEDSIQHTAVNDELEVKLGKAFDISVERKTTDVTRLSKKQTLLKREIKINNGSEKMQKMLLSEIMPTQTWSINKSSMSYQKISPSEAEFAVQIPAMENLNVSYDVVINYP